MSTHTHGFRPGLVAAMVKIAMIGTWRGRTFLDDDLELDDIADFVPDEPSTPVQLPVSATISAGKQPDTLPLDPPVADTGHSVAA